MEFLAKSMCMCLQISALFSLKFLDIGWVSVKSETLIVNSQIFMMIHLKLIYFYRKSICNLLSPKCK